MNYSNCTVVDTLSVCPINSICSKTSNDSFSCICLENFILNSQWIKNQTNAIYCLPVEDNANKSNTIYYLQPKASVEHLVLGIILVLVIAILVSALVYALYILFRYNPIERTRRAYVKMQLRRDNHSKLQEMDEIDLGQRDTPPVRLYF